MHPLAVHLKGIWIRSCYDCSALAPRTVCTRPSLKPMSVRWWPRHGDSFHHGFNSNGREERRVNRQACTLVLCVSAHDSFEQGNGFFNDGGHPQHASSVYFLRLGISRRKLIRLSHVCVGYTFTWWGRLVVGHDGLIGDWRCAFFRYLRRDPLGYS